MLVLLVRLLAVGCDQADDDSVTFEDVRGVDWIAAYLPQSNMPLDRLESIRFRLSSSRIAGYDGCNSVVVNMEQQENRTVRLLPWSTSEMACGFSSPFEPLFGRDLSYSLTRERFELWDDEVRMELSARH